MREDTLKKADKWKARFNHHTNLSLALSLFVLLVAIYSLTYSGTFITDDEHILTSRTLSLAFDEHLNNERVYGNSRLYFFANLSPEYAASAVNVEPGQAILGAILARLAASMNVGRIQTIFLLNIGATAFTAVILFGATRSLGYSKRTAFIVGILFGLGTVVWPYTQTYFRDPLGMMFLMVAWAGALIIADQRNPNRPKYINGLGWFGLLAGITAGILTKNTITIALPVLIIYLLAKKYSGISKNSLRNTLRNNWKKFSLLLGSILLALIAWFLFVPSGGIFERFTFHYYKYLTSFFFTTPHPKFLEALVGPLLSPGKSIFIYSPILVLSIRGSLKRWDIAWPAWFYLFSLIIGQALFYDDEWWGHINWGLRFIIPAIPPLMIVAIPTINAWLNTRKGRVGLLGLGGFSILIQGIGVLPPMRQYYVEMMKIDSSVRTSAMLWNPSHSAIAWHLKSLFSNSNLDLAAIRVGLPAIPVVIGFVLIIGLTILGLTKIRWNWLPFTTLFLYICLSISMLVVYSNDPAYYHSRNDLEAAKEKISQNVFSDDVVLIKFYSSPVWYYWMNWAEPGIKWISLPFYFPKPSLIREAKATQDPEVAMDEATLALFRELPNEYQRVWLVLPDDSPGATLNIEVDWLEAVADSSKSWAFQGDKVETRLYLFEFMQIP